MKQISKTLLITVTFFLSAMSLFAQKKSGPKNNLSAKYDLVPRHSKDTQYYEMQSTLQKHALDGTILGTDIYSLYLRCVPSHDPSKKDQYTCLKFTVRINNAAPVSIPSLVNWTYLFSIDAINRDAKEQLFGIDHSKFEQLVDENGKNLPIENTYHVYNAFIDFHSMSVFAEKTLGDSGIQELQYIGDRIVHEASYSTPPVNLGSGIAEGSYFKNGEITLLFKGLGLVNKRNCAIIEYDSGKSSFYMLVKPMPNMEMPTRGSSHYWGDIFKDLSSGWIQRAILHEIVISETKIPANNSKINSVIERKIIIQNVK